MYIIKFTHKESQETLFFCGMVREGNENRVTVNANESPNEAMCFKSKDLCEALAIWCNAAFKDGAESFEAIEI